MSETSKVRTTMRPDEEIEVDEVERETLSRRGLLYTGTATTDEGARRSQERQNTSDQPTG